MRLFSKDLLYPDWNVIETEDCDWQYCKYNDNSTFTFVGSKGKRSELSSNGYFTQPYQISTLDSIDISREYLHCIDGVLTTTSGRIDECVLSNNYLFAHSVGQAKYNYVVETDDYVIRSLIYKASANKYYGVTTDGGYCVLNGQLSSGKLTYSITPYGLGTTDDAECVRWIEEISKFIACGRNFVSISSNYSSWTCTTLSMSGNVDWFDCFYDGEKLVLIGSNSRTTVYSTSVNNGASWSTPTVLISTSLFDDPRSLTYTNGYYLILSQDRKIAFFKELDNVKVLDLNIKINSLSYDPYARCISSNYNKIVVAGECFIAYASTSILDKYFQN